MLRSAKGLPANRESEERDALELLAAGFTALAMRDGVTIDQLNAYRRQKDFLADCVAARYRDAFKLEPHQ